MFLGLPQLEVSVSLAIVRFDLFEKLLILVCCCLLLVLLVNFRPPVMVHDQAHVTSTARIASACTLLQEDSAFQFDHLCRLVLPNLRLLETLGHLAGTEL